jgi:hypothetical protein
MRASRGVLCSIYSAGLNRTAEISRSQRKESVLFQWMDGYVYEQWSFLRYACSHLRHDDVLLCVWVSSWIELFKKLTSLFSAAYVAGHISLSLPIVASVLFLLVMANLFKTSFTDPGILPRATNKEVIEHERIYKCSKFFVLFFFPCPTLVLGGITRVEIFFAYITWN